MRYISYIITFLLILLTSSLTLAQSKLPVVASFSILGDFVSHVGKDRVAVTTLVGPNGDAHSFEPSPADAKQVASAKVMIVNGLGFEGWMPRLIKASRSKAIIIEAAKDLKTRTMEEDGAEPPAGHDHHHDNLDPHAWQAIPNAKIMVEKIRDGLINADPDGRSAYEANATAYLTKLDELDRDIREAVAAIPAERRRVITSHDAFGYFAETYGIAFIAPQGVSTESEASAKAVAAIIDQIKAQHIPAVFMENMSDPRLIKRIADETGAKIGGVLFSDALSDPSGPAGTYIDMMLHNIKELKSALAHSPEITNVR